MCTFCENTYVFSKKQAIRLNKELDISSIVQSAIDQLYNDRKIDKDTRNLLMQSHYEPLKEAVNEGYGKTLAQIEYGTPNYEFLKALQTNTAVFAAFKNHAQMKEMAGMLKDEAGNLKSREAFKRDALAIDSKYRQDHLMIEYDSAVRQARMAANWQRYDQNKDLFPMLRYVLSKAAKPDETHKTFVGINRPVDDAFWDTHYPPNRWRCQCSVQQNDDDATDIPDNLPMPSPDFAFNSGKIQQVFDLQNSAYIKSVPPKEQPALIKQATTLVNTQAAINIPYQPLYKSKSGSLVTLHPLAFEADDVNENVKMAREMANSELDVKKIEVLPNLRYYPQLRKALLPDAKGTKNPDFRIDGVVCDMKTPSEPKAGPNTIKTALKNANDQGSGIVLPLKEGYISDQLLYENIDAKMSNKSFSNFHIYLRKNGEWVHFTKSTWKDFYKEWQRKK